MSVDRAQDRLPEIAMRIPGRWADMAAVAAALPPGCRLAEGWLDLPDGHRVAVVYLKPDTQFPDVFATACAASTSARDMAVVRHYSFNVGLLGPGGSLDAARRMLEAGAAVVRAGGAGVFVDNCAGAVGSDPWLELAAKADAPSIYRAFARVVAGRKELWSVGMHVLGRCDASLARGSSVAADRQILDNFLGFLCEVDPNLAEGDRYHDPGGLCMRLRRERSSRFAAGSPLHNPYGRWQLVRTG